MSVQTYIGNSSEAQLTLMRRRSQTQKTVGQVIQFLIDLLPLAFRIGLFALALFSLSTSYEFGTMTGGESQAFRWGGIFFVCAALNIILFKLRGQENRTGDSKAAITSMIAPLLLLDMLAIFGCTLGVNPPEMFTIGLAAIESKQVDIDYAKKKLSEAKRHSRYKAKPEGVLTVPVAESKKEKSLSAMISERARLKSEGIAIIKPNEVMYHVMSYATPLSPLMLQFINKMLFALCAMYVIVMGSKYSDELKLIGDEIYVAAGIRLKGIRDSKKEQDKSDLKAAFAKLEKTETATRYAQITPLEVITKVDSKAALGSAHQLPHNFDSMYEVARKAIVAEEISPSVRKIALLFYKADDMSESKMIKNHAELVHNALSINEIIIKTGDAPNSPFALVKAA